MGYSIFDETMVDMTWPEIGRAAAGVGPSSCCPPASLKSTGRTWAWASIPTSLTSSASWPAASWPHALITALIAPPCYWGISQATAVFSRHLFRAPGDDEGPCL